MALETKNTKLVAIAVGSLQKLFSRNAVGVVGFVKKQQFKVFTIIKTI